MKEILTPSARLLAHAAGEELRLHHLTVLPRQPLRYVLADELWKESKLPNGSRAKIRAGWAGGKLRINTVVDGGFKTTETWEVPPEAHRLVLVLQIETQRHDEPISVRRVFDRLEEPITDGR